MSDTDNGLKEKEIVSVLSMNDQFGYLHGFIASVPKSSYSSNPWSSL
jgi:hypothetical protein